MPRCLAAMRSITATGTNEEIQKKSCGRKSRPQLRVLTKGVFDILIGIEAKREGLVRGCIVN